MPNTKKRSKDILVASFILDRSENIEIGIAAEYVVEATNIVSPIKPLVKSADFLQGVMALRGEVIPVVNMKIRMGCKNIGYDLKTAKLAIIRLGDRRYGLLFDDIKDVLRVSPNDIVQLDTVLLPEDGISNGLIVLDDGNRRLELINLEKLFNFQDATNEEKNLPEEYLKPSTYSWYVIFSCCGQDYGVSVDIASEICFLNEIDDIFSIKNIAGVVQLRDYTIPIVCSEPLLIADGRKQIITEESRGLIIRNGEKSFALMVDSIKEVFHMADDDVLEVPEYNLTYLQGVYSNNGRNIMLIDIYDLVKPYTDHIDSLCRKSSEFDYESENSIKNVRHIITENSYLIFSIGRLFAIELKDVQEIIETDADIKLMEGKSTVHGLLILRGQAIPVLNLSKFYGYEDNQEDNKLNKIIIAKSAGQLLALQVDDIVTIYKQEQFYKTPSLRSNLDHLKDTLDRLVEYVDEDDIKNHVLVLNIYNILNNHLLVYNSVEMNSEGELI
ncbi:MAG: chemotaxis protein CheW [Desulfotalea sp.]